MEYRCPLRARVANLSLSLVLLLTSLVQASGCMKPRSHRVRVGTGTCATCHMGDYLAAGGTNVDAGLRCSLGHTSPYRFPTDCAFCHQDTDWCDVPVERVVGNHAASFELAGGHETDSLTQPTVLEQCVRCHEAPPETPDSPTWAGLGTDCASCHDDDRAAADDRFCAAANGGRGHGSFVGLACADCHRSTSWWPAVPGLHVGGRISSRHGGRGCQGCHDLDLLALQQPAGVLGECLPGGGTEPPPARFQFPVCNLNNDCPECSCVGCHSVSRNRNEHEGSRRAAYDVCAATIPTPPAPQVASARESMCWNCHTSGSTFDD